MPRPRSTGVKAVVRKRRDGTILRTDYYDPATMTHLGTDRAAALAAMKAKAAGAPRKISSLHDLGTSYLGTPEFNNLAPRTQKLNRLYVDHIRRMFGAAPAAGMTRVSIRLLRNSFAAQPVKGNRILATLRLILAHGVSIGVLKDNAASAPGRLKETPRSEVYNDDQIERFMDAASPELRRAMALLLYTVQRPSDVLAMTYENLSDRDGRTWVKLRQAKTDDLIDVPLHYRAAAILAEPLPPRSGRRAKAVVDSNLLIPSPTGRPWAYRNFARAWDRAICRADRRMARAMLKDGHPKEDIRARMLSSLQRRDLRRTGMVKMAQAGATPNQIAGVSGHDIDQVMRILKTYIPRRSEVARGAIEAWEAGIERGQVIAPAKSYGTGYGTHSTKPK